jgi:chaperone modulatory protein CbpM
MMFSREEFLVQAQLEHATLEAWIAEEWLVPGGSPAAMEFCDADLARAQLIRDLKADLGVNDEGVGIILNLIDQVHGLRRTLQQILQSRRHGA